MDNCRFIIKLLKLQLKLSILVFIYFNVSYAQSINEINKLKSEYEKLKKIQDQNITNSANFDQKINENLLPKNAYITGLNRKYVTIEDSLKDLSLSKYFGYNFFTKRDTVAFWENLPSPPNYVLGPGDEIIISIWGQTQLRQSFSINRDGTIYDDKVGQLDLLGKTLEKSKIYLLSQFGRVYATLIGSKPTSYIDVSLGGLKSINVNFVGNVKYPGVYSIHPFSNLITGLIQIGGVDTTGSLREINIRRNNKLYAKVDLYDYFLEGSMPNDIQLRDQDIVFIPTIKKRALIDSSVVRPGFYEFLNGESVKTGIKYAGGLSSHASQIISIQSIKPINERNSRDNNHINNYIKYDDSDNFFIENGDQILVRRIFNSFKNVEIIGQVKRPGIYPFKEGMTIKDLMELGGGFNDSTYLKSIYLDSGKIVRRNPLSRYETVISIKLRDYIGENSLNFELENLDRFVVHSNLNFFEKDNITISGEVNIPGSYPIIEDSESLNSIIQRAGGLTSKSLSNGISIYRDKRHLNAFEGSTMIRKEELQNRQDIVELENSKIRVAWDTKDIILMAGDSIVVKESTRTVNVLGEVYNPGVLTFNKNKSVNDYINSAGGITAQGNKNSVIVVYANGVVRPKRRLFSPRVLDGSTIVVNRKPPSEPFNITQFATNWTSIISSMITAIVLSRQIN